jgi:hypothetical protein
MYSIRRKKLAVFTSIILCFLLNSVLLAAPVSIEQVQKATETFLKVQDARQEKQITLFSVQVGRKLPIREFTAGNPKEIRDNDGIEQEA